MRAPALTAWPPTRKRSRCCARYATSCAARLRTELELDRAGERVGLCGRLGGDRALVARAGRSARAARGGRRAARFATAVREVSALPEIQVLGGAARTRRRARRGVGRDHVLRAARHGR